LLALRKQVGLSQEEAAEKLGVSRQTIGKWETGQTMPELVKAKQLSRPFNVSYNNLVVESDNVDYLTDMSALVDEIDWTKAWSKKYPILEYYPQMPDMEGFSERIREIYADVKARYGFNDEDTVLVVKDMVYKSYLEAMKKEK